MIYRFFTGSYGTIGEDGIAAFTLDTERKTLTKTYGFSGIHHPSWILLNAAQTRLYAVQEQIPEGKVHELSVQNGILTVEQTFESGGADPCHLSLNQSETTLLCANYTSGSLAAFALDAAGHIERMSHFEQYVGNSVNPVRQECPHIHFSREYQGLCYVCDLGTDRVRILKVREDEVFTDTGAELVLPDGYGPRHLEFHENHPELVYVLCELASKLVIFEQNGENYEIRQILSCLPSDFHGENTGSAIRHSGSLLFAANRGHDSIAVFEILQDGSLRRTQMVQTGGRTPRDMIVLGDYLVIANQDSDLLTVLKIGYEKKTLTDTGIRANTVRPTCICPIAEEI
ncbi:MAG: lactonase family protein [Lachnospiraceae bacterium]|nr:lactonase family protein [Lachnospiraceae bacterium]